VGLTIPFPGNCYAALRLAKTVRAVLPRAKIALGGGFAGGYLRDLDEPAVFEFVDYVILDDGERPLECLLEHLQSRRPRMRFPNAITQLWLDLRWNRLTLAHGCYWHKCAFCDTTLDYVCRYDPAPVALTLERMERIAAETGYTGFHFVDQAASPKLLRELSRR